MVTCILRQLTTIGRLQTKCIHTFGLPLLFQVTSVFRSEPGKKKRGLDPTALKKMEDRKMRKLEKGIRRLERVARMLQPIEEINISPKLLKELELRRRSTSEISHEETIYREKLKREWSAFKCKQFAQDQRLIGRLQESQGKALQELRQESEELYQAAIQLDPLLDDFEMTGPVFTPPIPKYLAPDGDFIAVAKKFRNI